MEGFGQGIENGSLSLFNAKTGGFYDVASYFFMKNDYEKRQEKMQKEAEKVGLGGLNKLADYAINIGESANILNCVSNLTLDRYLLILNTGLLLWNNEEQDKEIEIY